MRIRALSDAAPVISRRAASIVPTPEVLVLPPNQGAFSLLFLTGGSSFNVSPVPFGHARVARWLLPTRRKMALTHPPSPGPCALSKLYTGCHRLVLPAWAGKRRGECATQVRCVLLLSRQKRMRPSCDSSPGPSGWILFGAGNCPGTMLVMMLFLLAPTGFSAEAARSRVSLKWSRCVTSRTWWPVQCSTPVHFVPLLSRQKRIRPSCDAPPSGWILFGAGSCPGTVLR